MVSHLLVTSTVKDQHVPEENLYSHNIIKH